MLFNIKEKLNYLFSLRNTNLAFYKEYYYTSSSPDLKRLIYFFLFSIVYTIPFFIFGKIEGITISLNGFENTFIGKLYIYAVAIPISIIVLVSIFSIVLYFTENTNLFSKYLKIKKIEQEFIDEFGSVSNLIDIFHKLDFLNLDKTDKNIYLSFNEPKTILSGRIKIGDKARAKIEKLEQKIKDLTAEKNEVYLKSRAKQRDFFDRKNKSLEFRKKDISLNVGQFKDSILSSKVGLK